MNKKSYIPKISYDKLIRFYDEFSRKLLENISRVYKTIEIFMPLLTSSNSSINDGYSSRKITFDNNIDYQIYELVENYDNLMRYNFFLSNLNNDEVLFSKVRVINRDQKIKAYQNLETQYYAFEIFKKEEERSVETCFKEIENFVQIIKDTCASLNMVDATDLFKKISKVNASKISKLYPLLNDVASIDKYVKEKNICAISFDQKNFNSFFPFKSLVAYDALNTASLLVWSNQVNDAIEIMDVTFRPNISILENQINLNEYDNQNEFFNQIKSDDFKPSISVKIYLDKLLFYILDLNNIQELPSQNSDYKIKDRYMLFDIKKKNL